MIEKVSSQKRVLIRIGSTMTLFFSAFAARLKLAPLCLNEYVLDVSSLIDDSLQEVAGAYVLAKCQALQILRVISSG